MDIQINISRNCDIGSLSPTKIKIVTRKLKPCLFIMILHWLKYEGYRKKLYKIN